MGRTDQERFAWCLKHEVLIGFYRREVDFSRGKKSVCVDWLRADGSNPTATRAIPSSGKAHEAWQKAVDELMDKDSTDDPD